MLEALQIAQNQQGLLDSEIGEQQEKGFEENEANEEKRLESDPNMGTRLAENPRHGKNKINEIPWGEKCQTNNKTK